MSLAEAKVVDDPMTANVAPAKPADVTEISQPPSTLDLIADRAFRRSTWIIAWSTIALMFWLVISIGRQAMPAVRAYGISFLTTSTWDPNKAQFGILPAISGTMYSSVLGLIIGTIFGVAIAIFLSEGFLSVGLESVLTFLHLNDKRPWNSIPNRVEDFLKLTVELLAAVPSVVFGL